MYLSVNEPLIFFLQMHFEVNFVCAPSPSVEEPLHRLTGVKLHASECLLSLEEEPEGA